MLLLYLHSALILKIQILRDRCVYVCIWQADEGWRCPSERNLLSSDNAKNFIKWNLITKSTKPLHGKRNYDDSLIVFCCPPCLYGKLLSINKLEGFDTLISVRTFLTRWLYNCDLASCCTPFSCYHHPYHKVPQQSKMPTTESECHLFQQPNKNYFKTIEKIYLPYPNSTTDTQSLANTVSFRARKATVGFIPTLKTEQKYTTTIF